MELVSKTLDFGSSYSVAAVSVFDVCRVEGKIVAAGMVVAEV